MSTLRAAAQQALETLDTLYRTLTPETPLAKSLKQRADTLRAALAEPVEPVAWGVFGANLHDMFFTEEEAHEMARLKGDGSTVAPLYTSPPQRPAEPVAYSVGRTLHWHDGKGMNDVQLYATPPQRKPLTEDTIEALFEAELLALPPYPSATEELPVRLARAIEQAHGIGGKT